MKELHTATTDHSVHIGPFTNEQTEHLVDYLKELHAATTDHSVHVGPFGDEQTKDPMMSTSGRLVGRCLAAVVSDGDVTAFLDHILCHRFVFPETESHLNVTAWFHKLLFMMMMTMMMMVVVVVMMMVL